LVPIEVHYMEKNPGIFSSKTLISFRLKKERRGHLGWHANYQQKFLKVNYPQSFIMLFTSEVVRWTKPAHSKTDPRLLVCLFTPI